MSNHNSHNKPTMDGAKPPKSLPAPIRYLYIVLGITCVGLGMLGIVVPLLPTTPFMLLAAYLFVRSSQRLYRWLLTHRVFGSYIRNYLLHRAISSRVKASTLIILWGTIAFSAYLMMGLVWVQLFLLCVAIGVTIHILSLKTMKGDGTVSSSTAWSIFHREGTKKRTA